MAVGKKKNFPAPLVAMSVAESYDREHNNPNDDNIGVSPLPGNGTDPSEYNKNGITDKSQKKMCFSSMIAEGESPNRGDVNTVTPNGTGSSRGEGHNQEYNWSNGTDGRWNGNRGWRGGNRTGE